MSKLVNKVAYLSILSMLITSTVMATLTSSVSADTANTKMSELLNKYSLDPKAQNKTSPTSPENTKNDINLEQVAQSSLNQPTTGGMSVMALEGRTYVEPATTTSRSPVIYGYVPSWCDDVAVAITTDTMNTSTGEGIYAYFSEANEVHLETSLGSEYKGYWYLDLQANGLGLINGKYNILVASKCGYDSYSDPLYLDIHYDTLTILPAACDSNCVPVHRFYNTKNGAHFYTSSEYEKRTLIYGDKTFRYEGVSNFAQLSSRPDLVAVHRFYHKTNGVHFYTGNQAEATNVNNTQSHTYRYEGVAYYTSPHKTASTQPVHRFYKFKQGVHFYTSSQAEATNVNNTQSHTYRYEGVAYYNTPNN